MIRMIIPIGVVLLQLSIFLSAFVALGWVRATAGDPLSEADRIFVNVCQSIMDFTGPSLAGTFTGVAAIQLGAYYGDQGRS